MQQVLREKTLVKNIVYSLTLCLPPSFPLPPPPLPSSLLLSNLFSLSFETRFHVVQSGLKMAM